MCPSLCIECTLPNARSLLPLWLRGCAGKNRGTEPVMLKILFAVGGAGLGQRAESKEDAGLCLGPFFGDRQRPRQALDHDSATVDLGSFMEPCPLIPLASSTAPARHRYFAMARGA